MGSPLKNRGTRLKILFVHQNCPGQFKHLAPALMTRGDDVTFITQKGRPDISPMRKIEYAPHRKVTEGIHPYLASSEAAVLNGQAVARVALEMKKGGYHPDIIVGNPGWGETLFLKEVWPDAPLLAMVEFFYRGHGSDVGFDPEFDQGLDAKLRARARSGVHLLAINAADAAYAPTQWQAAQFPVEYQPKISVIHDGIDTDFVTPDPNAVFKSAKFGSLTRDDEVITFVARNLEPYRGFHSFIRSLPSLLKSRKDAKVIVVGGDDVSYGSRPKTGLTWRETMMEEVKPDLERVEFAGRVPYQDFVSLAQIASVHAYLTYPFVLSWSMLEVMAAGGVVVGSKTPPVEEVIEDGKNGFLVDFFDPEEIATKIANACAERRALQSVSQAARETILKKYALKTSLRKQIELIESMVSEPK